MVKNEIKMKIILSDPPFGRTTEKAVEDPNLGILYLIASLRKNITNLSIIYIRGYLDHEQQLSIIKEFQPDLYGISFTSVYASLSYKTLKAVRDEFPSILLVCGGPHPTAQPKDVFANSPANVCCIGEGEETIVELVRTYRDGGSLEQVNGIAYKNGKKVQINPYRPLIKKLDTIPFPAWDLIDTNEYLGRRKYRGYPSSIIQTSRGCPFNCTFCSNPVWKQQKPWLRKRSPKNIAAEVKILYKRGVREIYIHADEMNPDLDWSIEVFNELADLELHDLYLQANLRVRPINDALAEAMKRANCWLVHLGLESGNQRILDAIHKKISVENFFESCRILRSYNITIFAFCMFYQIWEEKGVLCMETPNEVLNTLWTLLKLRLRKRVKYMSWSFATPYPGSELYRVATKYNLIRKQAKSSKNMDVYNLPLKLPGIPDWLMIHSRLLGFLLQGLFLITSREFYGRKTLGANIKGALNRLTYIINVSNRKR